MLEHICSSILKMKNTRIYLFQYVRWHLHMMKKKFNKDIHSIFMLNELICVVINIFTQMYYILIHYENLISLRAILLARKR